jgi:hypothetical protein
MARIEIDLAKFKKGKQYSQVHLAIVRVFRSLPIEAISKIGPLWLTGTLSEEKLHKILADLSTEERKKFQKLIDKSDKIYSQSKQKAGDA